MRVIEVRRYGGPEVLAEVSRPEPAPTPGRVRVRVAAAPVNPVDLWARAGEITMMTPGLEPPFVLGWDFAGTVLEAAEGFAAGQPVVGMGAVVRRGGDRDRHERRDPVGRAGLAGAAAGRRRPGAGQHAGTERADRGPGARPWPGRTDVRCWSPGRAARWAGSRCSWRPRPVPGCWPWPPARTTRRTSAGSGRSTCCRGRRRPTWRRRSARWSRTGWTSSSTRRCSAARRSARSGTAGCSSRPAVAPCRRPSAASGSTRVGTQPDAARLGALLTDFAAGRLTTRVAGTLPLAEVAQAHRRAAARGLRGKLVLTP